MNIKKTIYTYHRQISLLIMIPVLLWVISGLMHPIMANWFRPTIAKTFIDPKPIDKSLITIDLQKAAQTLNSPTFNNVNFVQFRKQVFYQFHLGNDSLVYVNASTGNSQSNTDHIYAESLARYFLQDDSSEVSSIEEITTFNTEYREINRLLPVWKINFNNSAKMDVYVHTASSRLGTYNDTYRKWHIRIFNWFHNWGFIPGPEIVRVILVGITSALIFLIAVLGLSIYGFNWNKFKKSNATTVQLKKRKMHRRTGIIFSVFMLTFSFSGSYHVWMKLTPDDRSDFFDSASIAVSDIQKPEILNTRKNLVNFSMHRINNQPYIRTVSKFDNRTAVKYINAMTEEVLEQGDSIYSNQLAVRFSGLEKTKAITPIYKFKGEYGFVNKRLPVQKVDLVSDNNTSIYIEVKTGKLAARVNDTDRAEGYSFAILHKFHFLDGLGKSNRDLFAAFGALTLLITAYFGWRIK